MTMEFKNIEHENFYNEHISKCTSQDSYHKALLYTLGISENTRNHIDQLFDFNTNCLKMDWSKYGWLTGTDKKVILLAFDLYNCGQPTINRFKKLSDQIDEAKLYAPSNLFNCEYAFYFVEALKIRYSSEFKCR